MQKKLPPVRFKTILQIDVPQARNSKHKAIVEAIISDLDQLKNGSAVRIPLTELGDSKANVRSALNRVTRNSKRKVVTAADSEFLYVWNS